MSLASVALFSFHLNATRGELHDRTAAYAHDEPERSRMLKALGALALLMMGVCAAQFRAGRRILALETGSRAGALERRFSDLFESAGDGIILMEEDGSVSGFNAAAERMFGRGRAEVLGRSVSMLMPDRHRAAHEAGVARYRGSPSGSRVVGKLLSLEGLRKDGATFPIELTVSVCLTDGLRTFIGAVRDITERQRAAEQLREKDEQLRHAQKLEAVGRLAGGVAHDFNNILTVMLGNLHLVRELVPAEDPIQTDLAEVERGCRRAADLTRQLLLFSRRQRAQPRVVDARETLSGLGRMLARLVGERYRLRLSLAEAGVRVLADPAALEQVVLNFVVNSRDAMPDGGEIIISLRSETLQGPLDGVDGPVPPGRYARLSVKDQGAGIAPEVMPRIFEPFFTTKPVGKGSGLGLATAYGIVSEAGAFLRVETAVGQGTEMSVYWPITDAREETPSRPARAPGGGEAVLLAEDEPEVRRLAQRFLTLAGYTVTVCPDGESALAALTECHALLFTDMVMPGMSGVTLAAAARAGRPGIKVLFTTGYSDQMPELPPGTSLLRKPYTQADLLRAVRESLDDSA